MVFAEFKMQFPLVCFSSRLRWLTVENIFKENHQILYGNSAYSHMNFGMIGPGVVSLGVKAKSL